MSYFTSASKSKHLGLISPQTVVAESASHRQCRAFAFFIMAMPHAEPLAVNVIVVDTVTMDTLLDWVLEVVLRTIVSEDCDVGRLALLVSRLLSVDIMIGVMLEEVDWITLAGGMLGTETVDAVLDVSGKEVPVIERVPLMLSALGVEVLAGGSLDALDGDEVAKEMLVVEAIDGKLDVVSDEVAAGTAVLLVLFGLNVDILPGNTLGEADEKAIKLELLAGPLCKAFAAALIYSPTAGQDELLQKMARPALGTNVA